MKKMFSNVLYKKLISNENIYHAIYSLNSYIENKELLHDSDLNELYKLQDIFDEKLINEYICKVREKIKSLLKNDDYLLAKVYFKPKKYEIDEEKGKGAVKFRPLHTTSIFEYITIVAMMQVIVYESKDLCQDCNYVKCKNKNKSTNCNKIILSSLSRLIPHNFYGNKISTIPENFIIPWKHQYKEYTANANEYFKKYNMSGEFRYEVNLDLVDFFPSIDPVIVYNYVIQHLPVTYSDGEIELVKKILIKLLFIRIDIDDDNDEILNLYYDDQVPKQFSQNKIRFVRGLPQGLPHAYYFANLCMIEISKIYEKAFQGKSLYYVDDSVIFTNKIGDEEDGKDNQNNKNLEDKKEMNMIKAFSDKISAINEEIVKFEKHYKKIEENDNNNILNNSYTGLYGIKVHNEVIKEDSKSWFSDLTKASEGEIYLNGISRETSKTSFDIYTSQSDDEDITLKNRLFVLMESIQKELDSLPISKNDNENKIDNEHDKNEQGRYNKKTDINQMKIYRKKLLRYKKYFSYRYMLLNFREKNNYQELCEELLKKLELIKHEEDLTHFMKAFNDDIISAMITFVAKIKEKQKGHLDNLKIDYQKAIYNHIIRINNLIFGIHSESRELNKEEYSYFYKANMQSYSHESRKNSQENILEDSTVEEQIFSIEQSFSYVKYNNVKYNTLKNKVVELYPNFKDWHASLKEKFLDNFISNIKDKRYNYLDGLKQKFFPDFFDEETCKTKIEKDKSEEAEINMKTSVLTLVDENSDTINRMLLNTIFSHVFNLDISDKCNFAKGDNRMISYKELRIIMFLRNPHFKFDDFVMKLDEFKSSENRSDIDYSILKVIGIFKTFVGNANQIDDLILVHRYTNEIWKNGSKYLYFYTLHNQEHAIELISNSIKIVKSISFIQISQFDYYILFIACYLHDISMVTIPSLDRFLLDQRNSNIIYNDFVKEITGENSTVAGFNKISSRLKDSSLIKKLLNDYYKRIDEFYENEVRSNHHKDSAREIRSRSDLKFLDGLLRDIIAEVAEAHCYDTIEVYNIKSSTKGSMPNKKFMKIVLRLADLLDMSEYRVSQPILNNNLNNMSTTSAFHWLSHIVTEGYEIEVDYDNNKINDEEREKEESNSDSDKCEKEEKTLKNNNEKTYFLNPKSISEIITIKIKVKVSQMNKLESKKCKNMNLIDTELKNCSLKYQIGNECKSKNCNFLCQWVVCKNEYLFNELSALQIYLNNNINNYYKSKFYVVVEVIEKTSLNTEQLEIVNTHITKNCR